MELHDGLRGFNGTVHGGMICSILDEAMIVFMIHSFILYREAKAKDLIPKDTENACGSATASMDVKFLRPLFTPAVVLVKVSLERKEGKKVTLHAAIRDKSGKEYATCTALFIKLPKSLL
ncbi:HotDog domain-containing protein [Xylaria sp. FL1042]|nr:HotDog domain-containing protein [Xylaria sp. FL1042]KAI0435395.1 HotDog domain-containing protein [Xylaria sp. FL1042]